MFKQLAESVVVCLVRFFLVSSLFSCLLYFLLLIGQSSCCKRYYTHFCSCFFNFEEINSLVDVWCALPATFWIIWVPPFSSVGPFREHTHVPHVEWIVPFYPGALKILKEFVPVVKCWSFALQPPPSYLHKCWWDEHQDQEDLRVVSTNLWTTGLGGMVKTHKKN